MAPPSANGALVVLKSIMREEAVFVRLINTEAAKNSAAATMMLNGKMDAREAIAFQRRVIMTMREAIKLQLMLQDELERFLYIYGRERRRRKAKATPAGSKVQKKSAKSARSSSKNKRP